MNIAAILKKVANGEDLTDVEKKALAEYDPQKAIDDAAAAARRKAEERQAEAEKEVEGLKASVADLTAKIEDAGNAGKSDLEKAQAEVEKLAGRVKERDEQIANMTAEVAKREREGKIGAIMDGSGITFIEGVDKKIMKGAFVTSFANLDDKDLDDQNVTGPLVEAFRTANKATIVDKSGHGSGGNGHDGSDGSGPSGDKTPDKQTTEERAAAVRKIQ